MLTRRTVLLGSSTMAIAAAGAGCSADQSAYAKAVADLMTPLPANADSRDLIRYATLAANSHNTQPWMFRIREDAIEIIPDFGRRTPVVDPDDHHLLASLGCAAENLHLAARARALDGAVEIKTGQPDLIRIATGPAAVEESALLGAIPERQCSRVAFDGRPIPNDVLNRLQRSALGLGTELLLISEKARIESILELVVDANGRQIDNPAFRSELKDWIRFNSSEALAKRDGLYSAATGNPAIPSWLGRALFDLLLSKQTENDRYASHIRSSAGIAVFVAATDDKKGWFDAGRAFQRFALQATVDGLKMAFINQPIEVPAVRAELQKQLKIGSRRPNLMVRIGYGPIMPKSLRRGVNDVLV